MTGDLPEPGLPAPEVIREKTRTLALQWIAHRQGSPAELIRALEEEVGWPARHCLSAILDDLRASRGGPELDRKYLLYTLSAGAVAEALAGGMAPHAEHHSCLDELFARSRRYRRTKKYSDAVDFISRFRGYSPFNNTLVYLQNPMATYFATASHWHKVFQRTIKDEARGMIILAPRTPVLLVYDVADTDGPPLPDKLEVFTRTSGRFNPMILERTIKNCGRDRIRVERKPMGQLRGGFSTARVQDPQWKMRIGLRQDMDEGDAYAVLCHELAHIYLGHLGAGKEGGWPYRLNLPLNVAEIEAESVAFIVCRRAGLRTHAAEFLASYMEDSADLDSISIDLVSRAAGRIEDMGRRLLTPRDKPAQPKFGP
jgi:hypothetical protein